MTVFCLQLREVSAQILVSEFWTLAQHTKQLSDLRVTPRAPKPTVNDSMIALPLFMPLCGNGKIDTRADYQQYYADSRNKPLTLTKQQILYTGTGLNESDKLYNISFLVDEECDDGNRLDFDGCSADCMYMDLWGPPCELAVDKRLEYEDLIYDKVRKRMVVSASDGIYSLEIAPGDSQITSRLLASKNFPVTSIFRHSGALVLYSAMQQEFWQLRDGLSASITHLRTLPANMTKSSSSDEQWRVILTSHEEDGPIIVRDKTSLLYLASPSAPAQALCIVPIIADKKCSFIEKSTSTNAIQILCDYDRITIGPNNTCESFPGFDAATGMVGNIWSDIFDMVSYKRMSMNVVNKETYVSSPELSPSESASAMTRAIEAYHPMGGFVELTINPYRKFGATPGPAQPPIIYYTGEPSLISMLSFERTCGLGACIFDNDPNYDVTEQNSLKYAMGTTWNAILQDKVNRHISPPNSTLYDLKSNASRYRDLINSFAQVYEQITAPLAILTMLKHPENHNLWAIRKDKLIEVSKSGALLSRPDGKCIPSGIALCRPCYWAPNGQQCRPCSEKDDGSWAWSVSCPASCAASTGRRLLLGLVVEEGEWTIQFALKPGNLTSIRSTWPTAYTNEEGLIAVSVVTTDVMGEMRRIKLRLLGDSAVVIPPYVVIPVAIKASNNNVTASKKGTSTSTSESSNTPSVIIIVTMSVVLVVIIVFVIFAFLHNSRHTKAIVMHGRRRGGYHQPSSRMG